jgi:hypothetical protein
MAHDLSMEAIRRHAAENPAPATEWEEFEALLERLQEAGIKLRVPPGTNQLKAWPGSRISEEDRLLIKKYKDWIVRVIQDGEYVRTGVIQCDRHVFELAGEAFGSEEEPQLMELTKSLERGEWISETLPGIEPTGEALG